MSNYNAKTISAVTLLGLLFTIAAAEADYAHSEIAPEEKINLCVATIGSHADYADSSYVRHEVRSRARATLGYTLNIDTLVYDASGDHLVREYRTLCAVSDREEPVAFRIREKK